MKKSLFLLISAGFFAISSLVSIAAAAWSVAKEIESPVVSETNEAICYNKNTGYTYTKLDSALNEAKTGEEIYFIAGTAAAPKQYTIPESKDDLLIKSGVSLYLPYNGETYLNTDYSVSMPIKNTLSVILNRNLIIEGTLYIGGYVIRQGVAGEYANLKLGERASISIENGGVLECYGYIEEVNPNHNGNKINVGPDNLIGDNGIYDNSNDPYRYIHAKSGGKIVSPFAIEDLPGSGGTLQELVGKNICPFNIFSIPCLKTYVRFDFNSIFNALVTISISNLVSERKNIDIVSSSGLFKVLDGNSYLAYEWCATTLMRFYLNGNLRLGNIVISMAGQTINTANMFLPISYKINIFACSGSNVDIPYNVKLLPGSVLKIVENGKINIGNNVSFTVFSNNTFEWNNTGTTYPKNKGDALFINNGNVITNQNTKFGGMIRTESLNTNAIFNATQISNQDNLTVVSTEGRNEGQNALTIAQAYFLKNNVYSLQNLKAGTLIHSNGSLIDGKIGFSGQFFSTYFLTINVLDSTYNHPVSDYKVYTSDNPEGNSPTDLTSVAEKSSKVFSINDGLYFRVDTFNRVKSATFDNGIKLDPNKWYKIESDTKINIEPNEGIILSFNTLSISGASNVKIQVMETLDNGLHWFYSANLNNLQFVAVKNSNFKAILENPILGLSNLETKFLKGDHIFKCSISNDEYTDPTKNEVYANGSTFNYGQEYLADQYYTVFNWGKSPCILPDTLVTLANGATKTVDKITTGDMVKVFNHYTGKIDIAPIMFNVHSFGDGDESVYEILTLHFSDGTKLEIVGEHALFDCELNEYVYLSIETVKDYVDHSFVKLKDNDLSSVVLTSYDIQIKQTKVYSPVTQYHINFFSNDLLGLAGSIDGLFNYFELDENMKVDKAQMERDIEQYGLYTYDDFKDLLPYEIYDAFNLKYMKIAIGKGLLTYEDLMSYINSYKEYWE